MEAATRRGARANGRFAGPHGVYMDSIGACQRFGEPARLRTGGKTERPGWRIDFDYLRQAGRAALPLGRHIGRIPGDEADVGALPRHDARHIQHSAHDPAISETKARHEVGDVQHD